MVAITVILAAVIGAFVLEIGDQQETAPNTSFDTEQSMEYYEDKQDNVNTTEVTITHAGGDTLGISQSKIISGGNESWWRPTDKIDTSQELPAQIQPDITRTAGSNARVSFTSGASWVVAAGNNDSVPSRDNVQSDVTYSFDLSDLDNNGDGRGDIFLQPLTFVEDDDATTGAFGAGGALDTLQSGDTVRVVWTASSGGKTSTLFEYEVQ